MSDEERDIVEKLAATRFRELPERDSEILAAATAALQQGSPSRWPSILRRAAIVLLPLGLVAALIAYLNRPALTLAQVTEAYGKQKWVHIKFDSGDEHWSNLESGKYFFWNHDGGAVYTEPDGLRLWWWAKGDTIEKDQWYAGPKPPDRPRNETPWQAFVQIYQTAATMPANGAPQRPDVERHDDTLDGRNVVRFDCFYVDALNRRLLVEQLWADPRSRLPVQRREVLDLAAREEQKRDATVGKYDFPDKGPETIYDLGVPRGLPIVDNNAKPADDAAQVLAGGEAARKGWPKCYRMLLWKFDEDASIFYVDGDRWSQTRWTFSPFHDREVDPFPKQPVTIAQVEQWMITTRRTPWDLIVEDGQRGFTRSNNLNHDPNEPAASTRVMGNPHFPDNSNYPPGTHWPYVNVAGAPVKIDAPAEAPRGIVVLRREAGNRRTDYWIDPARDFICVKNIWQEREGAGWKNKRVEVLDDLQRLSTGQWYSAKRSVTQATLTRGAPGSTWIEYANVKVLESKDIPAGTFDGEKLLKGAKVETY